MNYNVFIIGYLAVINLILFCLMGLDKLKARRHKWRIPEKVLLTLGVLGGGVGGLVGQQLFRHKTRKPIFYVIFILGLIAAAALIGLLK